MLRYLVIDTETNGLFNFKLPADAEGQPRLAHLAMIEADENGVEIDRTDIYVKPNGWNMTAGASIVNGLTDEFLHANGSPIEIALQAYREKILSGQIVVAFNAQYDLKVMRGEFRRCNMPDLFEQTPNICVMRPMTAICQIPRANGAGIKFPNLAEAMAYFGHTLDGAHQAINDAEGALKVMVGLMRMGALPAPAVHYAKEQPASKAAAPRRKAAAASSAFPDRF